MSEPLREKIDFADRSFAALLSVLRCPECRAGDWDVDPQQGRVTCRACGRAHTERQGVLIINVLQEHAEVQQERTSVAAIEHAPELGGWGESYTYETDPASPLAQAYLSLPYGNQSDYFRQPGYFQNVNRFAAEFAFILRHLPTTGVALDVGADGTWSTARLAQHGLTCVALDITNHLATAALFQTASPRYALVNVDMHEPIFAAAAFDVITAFNALHHSTRLDALVSNLVRALAPGGVLGMVEPYVQNAAQEAEFGAPQSSLGINENVHTVERWHQAFTAAGLTLQVYSLGDSFNAIYRKPPAVGSPRGQDASALPIMDDYYAATLAVSPPDRRVQQGETARFDVTVGSRGRAAWASRGPLPVRLSYHLTGITADGDIVDQFDNDRTELQSYLCPGSPETFAVPVTIPAPGHYQLEFDLVHEARVWFKERGGKTAKARLVISSAS